jgi:hypothetical protein
MEVTQEELRLSCGRPHCPFFQVYVVSDQGANLFILKEECMNHEHNLQNDPHYQTFLAKKELVTYKPLIQNYVEQSLNCSPKPILKRFISEQPLSPLLHQLLNQKNNRLRKKFDNIVNQFKRELEQHKKARVPVYSEPY